MLTLTACSSFLSSTPPAVAPEARDAFAIGGSVPPAGTPVVYFASPQTHSVYLYGQKAERGQPVGEVSGFRNPRGVAVDGQGNLYVADTGADVVYLIPDGFAQSQRQLTGTASPGPIAVTSSGEIFVAQSERPLLSVYTGDSKPSRVIAALFHHPIASVATNSAGDAFVSNRQTDEIDELQHGKPAMIRLGRSFPEPRLLVVDDADNLLVFSRGEPSVVSMFAPPYTGRAFSVVPLDSAVTAASLAGDHELWFASKSLAGVRKVSYPAFHDQQTFGLPAGVTALHDAAAYPRPAASTSVLGFGGLRRSTDAASSL